ncbi:MAG: CsgG/HfaB family protein [Candidatus Firestonebacteria bacterium]
MKKLLIVALVGMVFVSGCSMSNSFICKTRVTDKVANSKGELFKNRSVMILQDFTYAYYRLPDYLSKSLTEALMASGYTVVERSNLDTIFSEQKMALSGVVKNDEKKDLDNKENGIDNKVLDKASITKIGEITGANTILMVFASPESQDKIKNLNLRMVDISTAEVIFTLNLSNEGTSSLDNKYFNPLIEYVMSEHKKGAKVIFVNKLETNSSMSGFSSSTGSTTAIVSLKCLVDGKEKTVPLDDILKGIK